MRKCAICGKGSKLGGTRKLLRGHYNLTKTSRKYPNLQWVRLPAGKAGLASGKRVKACVACIKNLRKTK
jgi:ribosomal protein L28